MVTIMKVPPTSKADSATVRPLSQRPGSSTPTPISRCETAQTCSREARRIHQPAMKVDSAAVRPNSGHARPNSRGSSTTERASTGRNVAGRM